MKISKLKVFGYQAIGEIEWNLPSDGLHLIQGVNHDKSTAKSNGSGKSTLLDAIYWVNYDKSVKKLDVKGLVNWHHRDNKLGMYVSQTIPVGNEMYEFIRSRGHPEYGTGFDIVHDGKSMQTHRKEDMEQVFDSLITQSAREFRGNTYITYNMGGRFTSLTDNQQKDVIEKAFELESTIKFDKIAQKVLSDWMEIYRGHLNEIERYESQISIGKGDLETYAEKNKGYAGLVKKVKDELKENEKELKESKETYDSRDKKEQEAKELMDACVRKLREKEQERDKMTNEMLALDKEIKKADRLLEAGKCPECGTKMTKIHLHGADWDKKVKERDTLIDDIAKNKGMLERVKELESVLEKDWKKKQNDTMIGFRTQSQLQALVDSFKKQSEQENPYGELISEKKEQMKGWKTNLKMEKKERDEAEEKLGYYKQACKVFDTNGIRIIMMDYYIKILNQHLLNLCNQIGEGDIIVQLKFKGKKTNRIQVDVPTQRGGYHALSDGEKRYIDWVIQMALYQVAATQDSPFLVLDEIFSLIDNTRLRHIFSYLESIAIKKPIFIITHNEYAQTLIPNQITVVRENNQSKLEIS